jgi:hypothetical protein
MFKYVPINLSKYMWKLVFNVVDVIFKFESPKRKTHEIHKNNASSKTFKKYVFGTIFLKKKQKLQLIWTYENMVKL